MPSLSNDIARLTAELELHDGIVALPDARYAAWRERFSAVTSAETPQLFVELIALGVKLARIATEDGGSTDGVDPALIQLAELAFVLKRDADVVVEGFERAGVDLAKAQAVTGQTLSNRPPERGADGTSPLALRLKRR
jgi:hypothetical protein